MTQLPNDTVLRLAEEAGAIVTEGSEYGVQIYAFAPNELSQFAALIQAELKKVDNEVSDAHDLLDRHQVPRNTKFGIPLSLLGRIATSFTDEQL